LNKGDAVREAEAVEHLTEIDAAAVWTSGVWPSRCIVPTWPSKVGGLTKHDAPSTAVTPPGSSRHCDTSTQRCCDYIAPSSRPSVLPSSACADVDEPATTTLPAPSFPTRERVADTPGKPSQHFGRDRRRHSRRLARGCERRRCHVGPTEQQSEVRRIDRCRIDTYDHVAVTRRRDVDRLQRQVATCHPPPRGNAAAVQWTRAHSCPHPGRARPDTRAEPRPRQPGE
jgi:hypothetical protein